MRIAEFGQFLIPLFGPTTVEASDCKAKSPFPSKNEIELKVSRRARRYCLVFSNAKNCVSIKREKMVLVKREKFCAVFEKWLLKVNDFMLILIYCYRKNGTKTRFSFWDFLISGMGRKNLKPTSAKNYPKVELFNIVDTPIYYQ